MLDRVFWYGIALAALGFVTAMAGLTGMTVVMLIGWMLERRRKWREGDRSEAK